MENYYNIKKWEEASTKNLFVWKFFLGGNEVPEWKLTEVRTTEGFKEGIAKEYYWENKEQKEEAIKIDIIECYSWQKAEEMLMNIVNNHMAPRLAETKIGDTSYTGFGDVLQHIIFVRANMVVVLKSIGKKDISVKEFSAILDELFYSKPIASEKGVLPAIASFSIADRHVNITEKNAFKLEVTATDPLERPLWYKFFADNGEFLSTEGEIYFIPADGLKGMISVYATNENRFITTKTIDLNH